MIDRVANGPWYFGLFSIRSLTDQCLSFQVPRSSCCIVAQQFCLRFNDYVSLPATPCDMNATWSAPLQPPASGGLPGRKQGEAVMVATVTASDHNRMKGHPLMATSNILPYTTSYDRRRLDTCQHV